MGTMSINVLERTREIGVMRAIGASTLAILQIFLVEGMTIGWLGWMIGALLAIPLNSYLGNLVGWAFMQTTLVTTYSVNGAFLWLGAMLLISLAASFVPAYRASRYTVRDALSYE
jgi:putative ABC transport system permease protein